MKKILLVGLVAVGLVGCASDNRPKNTINYNQLSSQLSVGMDKGQVTTLLGSPRRTEFSNNNERWHYWNNALMTSGWFVSNQNLAVDKLTVTFNNGRVTRWGQTDSIEMMMDNMKELQDKSIENARDIMKANQK